MGGLGKDLGEGSPKAEGSVTDGEHRSCHAAALEPAQHVGPGLGGLAMSVADRDQLLGAVAAHTDDDQGTQPGLFEADVEVDAVRVEVDVVDVFEGAVGELVPFLLPVGGQPGDHRSRQPGGRAEELLKGGHEVSRAHPVQVHQRQHLGHLGRLAGPRRQDRAAEAHLLAGLLVDPAVVDPRRPDLDRPGAGDQRPRLGVSVAHNQAMPVFVDLVRHARDVAVDLGF